MSSVANVSAGKPRVGGAIYWGATTLTAPTAADATLPAGFNNVGYISDAGVVNANARTSASVKAWGGDEVLNLQTEYTDRYTFTMIEMLNENVQKAVHGETNVEGNLTTGLHVKANSKELEPHIWVIDQVLTDGVLSRFVIPDGKVIEVADVTYADNSAVGYQVTIAARPDANGDSHHEYYKSA